MKYRNSIFCLVSCEHGGNRVPQRYRSVFRGRIALLRTHRGYDVGALATARSLQRVMHAPLIASTVSRLLVDLNRSLGHRQLFSEMTRSVSAAVRNDILRHYYWPYRNRVEETIEDALRRGKRVLHVSSHSFTPVFDHQIRTADVAFLYAPDREQEAAFCARWQEVLKERRPDLSIRRNYPYRGSSDGLTKHLRQRFGNAIYSGIELEINQAHALVGGRHWRKLRTDIAASLREVVAMLR